MTPYEHSKIEMELKLFTKRNFIKPDDCRNVEQIRFYVRELCLKIEDLEERFNYVPAWAYALLTQYNTRQNSIISAEFKNSYC